MTKVAQKPIIHGRDHAPGGADPIPGLAGASIRDTILAAGPWAYWPLDEASGLSFHDEIDARDLAGVNGTGASPHSFSYGLPGPTTGDLALEFRGSDSGVVNTLGTRAYVDLTSGDALTLYGSDGFSVELWLWAATPAINNQNGLANYDGFLVSYSTSSPINVDVWRLYLDGDNASALGPGMLYLDYGATTLLGSGAALSAAPDVPGAWNHVVVSYDGTGWSLYLNGVLADSATATAPAGTGRLQLGRPVNRTYAQYFEGRMAHVALYAEALDADTIAGHAGATGGGGGGGGTGPAGPPGPTGATGATGASGAPGATGATGPAGPGVAVGGSTGQVLTKTSATDYATNWQTPAASTFVSGTGAPSAGIGVNGAIYLDTASGKMYGPKAAGAWPATPFGRLLLPGNTYTDVTAKYGNYAALLAG